MSACEFLLKVDREKPNDGILALRELTRRCLMVTKPHVLADLFVHRPYDFAKPDNMRNFLRNLVGDGLLIVEGESHKFLRKKTSPAFSFRRVKDLYPMMWKNSLRFAGTLEADIQGQESKATANPGDSAPTGTVELTHWANMTTLNIIGNAVLGRDFDVFGDSDDLLLKSYGIIFDPTKEMLLYLILSAWLSHRLAKFLAWRVHRVFKETTAQLKRSCLQLVRDRQRTIKDGSEHFDILSLLIKSDAFSDDEMADQLLTYLAAGHDTTALTLTWACYFLALDTTLQETLRREVRDNLPPSFRKPEETQFQAPSTPSSPGDKPRADSIADIMERLPMLNGVISETLRLYPTVPVTIRSAVRDTCLAGQPIPKGTEILISPWVINRSRELWGAEADVFRPERWISSSSSRVAGTRKGGPEAAARGEDEPGFLDGKPNYVGGASSNYDFMTFLHGPRSCIGQGFARAELRCLLAALVSRFEWTLDMDVKDVVPSGAITLKPQNGLYLKFKILGE
ncbi:hypothetical protein DL770_009537 [Monosporascus sp. CRB-9-2]|nr:hypothetical protein DL770_009537 [Monosporascus sp. CRB-9-2]